MLSAEYLEVSRRNNRVVTTRRGGPWARVSFASGGNYTRLKISHFLVSISTPGALSPSQRDPRAPQPPLWVCKPQAPAKNTVGEPNQARARSTRRKSTQGAIQHPGVKVTPEAPSDLQVRFLLSFVSPPPRLASGAACIGLLLA